MLANLYPPAPPPATRAVTWEQAPAAGLVAAPTAAGVNVTADTALTASAVFAAVRKISAAVGSLPLCLYRREADGGRSRAGTHPAYRLLHDAPGGDALPFVFWSAFVTQMLLHGKGVAEIERDGAGRPLALWPLPANRVSYRPDGGFTVHGNSREVDVPADDMFHVPYFSTDGYTGQGIIQYARETIGQAKGVTGAGANHINNMIRPSGVVTIPPGFSEDARENIVSSITRTNAGGRNAGRVLLLEDGVGFTPFSISNEEAQWLESRAFDVLEVARFFSISPTKLAELGRATWGNIESENRSFYEETLIPICVPICQEAGRKLVAEPDRAELYAEHVLDARIRGNTTERYAAHQSAIQAGWKTRNEVRVQENLSKLPGLDVPLAPQNMAATNPTAGVPTPDEQPGNPKPAPTPDDGPDPA